MGDRLQAGKPSPSFPQSSTGYWLGLRRGEFTCVGWQVTLCDPIWQVTSYSSEMDGDDDDELISYVRPLLQLQTVTSVLMIRSDEQFSFQIATE